MSKPILKSARKREWADLDLDFIAHPTTGDIVKKIGPDAVKRSVRNLILTNYYDRPFRSYIGSNVQKLLFEHVNPLTAAFIKDAVIETIENFEPRVKLRDDENRGVVVKVDPDGNGFIVDITYVILNRNETIMVSLFLERIR